MLFRSTSFSDLKFCKLRCIYKFNFGPLILSLFAAEMPSLYTTVSFQWTVRLFYLKILEIYKKICVPLTKFLNKFY